MVIGEFERVVEACRRRTFNALDVVRQLQILIDTNVEKVFNGLWERVIKSDDENERLEIFCEEWISRRNNETIVWIMEASGCFDVNFSRFIVEETSTVLQGIAQKFEEVNYTYEILTTVAEFKRILNKHRDKLHVRELLWNIHCVRALPVIDEDGFDDILWLMEHGAYNTFHPTAVSAVLCEIDKSLYSAELDDQVSNLTDEVQARRKFCAILIEILRSGNNSLSNDRLLVNLTQALRFSQNEVIASDIETKLFNLCLLSSAVLRDRYRNDWMSLFSNIYEPLIENVPLRKANSFYTGQNKAIQIKSEHEKEDAPKLIVCYSGRKASESLSQDNKLCRLLLYQKRYILNRSCESSYIKARQDANLVIVCVGDTTDDQFDDTIKFSKNKTRLAIKTAEEPLQEILDQLDDDEKANWVEFSKSNTLSRTAFQDATEYLKDRIAERSSNA